MLQVAIIFSLFYLASRFFCPAFSIEIILHYQTFVGKHSNHHKYRVTKFMMVAIFSNYIYIESYYIYDGCYIFKLYLYRKLLYLYQKIALQNLTYICYCKIALAKS